MTSEKNGVVKEFALVMEIKHNILLFFPHRHYNVHLVDAPSLECAKEAAEAAAKAARAVPMFRGYKTRVLHVQEMVDGKQAMREAFERAGIKIEVIREGGSDVGSRGPASAAGAPVAKAPTRTPAKRTRPSRSKQAKSGSLGGRRTSPKPTEASVKA